MLLCKLNSFGTVFGYRLMLSNVKSGVINDLSRLTLSPYAVPSQNDPVFTVKARDPDTGINDMIHYSIESESAGKFILKMHLNFEI